MAIVDDLTKIRDWLQTEVCDKVKFKLPDEQNADGGYSYELVKPSAFILCSRADTKRMYSPFRRRA